MIERRQVAIWAWMALAVGGGWALVAPLLGYRLAHHGWGRPAPWLIVAATLAATLAIAWTFAFARVAFNRFDEFQRALSLRAWYWGAAIGIAVSAPLYVFVALGGLAWLFPHTFDKGPVAARAFAAGYALPTLFQGAGCVGVALWLRIARR